MASEVQGAINVLLEQIESKTREINEIKRTINGLRRATGSDPLFNDTDMQDGVTGRVAIKTDTFYGIGPFAAVRKYLEMRGKTTGAASLDEIFEALKKGGFNFAGQGWSDVARWKNQVSIAIGKNPDTFHRLPNDSIGLTSWYPEAAPKKKGSGKANGDTKSAPDSPEVPESDKAEQSAPEASDTVGKQEAASVAAA